MFTNQEQIYNDLLKDISPFSASKVISMTGKPGVGKTFVVETLMSELQNNYSCPICYIRGDQFCKNRDYYCIKQALGRLTKIYEKSKLTKDIMLKGTEGIPYLGPLVTQLLSNKLNNKKIAQEQKNHFLTEEEQNIIYQFNYIFDKRSALIICDDLQYFDDKSLELIYFMIASTKDLFVFFNNCQFLLVHTDMGETLHPIIQNILTERCQKRINMPPVQGEDINEILKRFGCNVRLDEEIKEILFRLSDGHLEIIKQMALYLTNSRESIKATTDMGSTDDFIENLVAKKLAQLGASGQQISTLLEYASLIGKTFSNVELSMSMDLNKQEFRNAIKNSNKLALISSEGRYSNFSHDIIHVLFRKRADKNRIYYYEKMRNCVKYLTPTEYVHRIDIERNLGNFWEASILIVLFSAKHGYSMEFEDLSYNQLLSFCPEIKTFLHNMHMAYEEYQKENYSQTLLILNAIDDFLPVQLLAERDLLKSITLTKSLNDVDRQEAINCLENYTLESLNNEGDLYLQIQLSLISSYAHFSEIDKARECEKRLSTYLVSKREYDTNACSTINILRRKANSIHECLYAEKHIRKSVEYFAPLQNQNAPLNPIQYLMSLVNHAGILAECGRFRDSYSESVKARKLVKNNENILFPRMHIIDNNYLISLFLTDDSVKRNVMEAYKGLLNTGENADNIFILSNYCAFLAVNGFPKKAYDILEKRKVSSRGNREPFYDICTDNNLLVLKLFYKEYEAAQVILNRLFLYIENIIDESYYRKKYELFQYVIDQKIDISIEKIDTFLFDLCDHFQEAWAYWGRSFDYTMLYYWSDM